jgi:sigma-54 dependent transcriptional regulator, acetoin dehydrogenase operon transcriptional activator AcoR
VTELATAQAWERFASGDEVDAGVRPEILLSWARCRDRYHVDPARTEAPSAHGSPPLGPDETVVAAELGAAAMSISSEVKEIDGVVAVADGGGRVLSAWGSGPAVGHSQAQNLGPMYAWSEPATGTTGIGTALATREAVMVNRHEHWCAAFHDWSCAAVAVCDPIARQPVGVIDISVWRRPMPAEAVAWLGNAVRGIEQRLADRATRAYADLVQAYHAQGDSAASTAVLDAGGRVIVGDAEARAAMAAAGPELGELAQSVVDRARRERGWTGTAELAGGALAELSPISSADRVVGVLVRLVGTPSEPPPLPAGDVTPLDDRLVGMHGERLVLVPLRRVRYVEISRGTVWLDTDGGRLRAPGRTLDRLEQRLETQGFMRVNRSTLVNLSRIRELAPSFKDGLWVLVDGSDTLIPVSRRRAAWLRSKLGV